MSKENVELVRALNAWIEVDEGLAEPGRLYEFFAPDGALDLSAVLIWLEDTRLAASMSSWSGEPRGRVI